MRCIKEVLYLSTILSWNIICEETLSLSIEAIQRKHECLYNKKARGASLFLHACKTFGKL